MDLLSLIGMATKRRADYFSQAESFAKKFQTVENVEKRMKDESRVLVKGLRDKQMRWEEYERSVLDKTLVTALASVYLGAQDSNPKQKMEKSWSTIVGDMLPPLNSFLTETRRSLDNGSLVIGQDLEEFAEGPESWGALLTRLIRYLANPAYSFFNLGEYYVRQEQGYKQMRRVPRLDDRTCEDCVQFGRLGWQPIGTLPMPGRQCECYDRCRCSIEYR